MTQEQKFQFLCNLIKVAMDLKPGDEGYYSLWRQINDGVDSFYLLFDVDVVIDPINKTLVYVD